MSNPYWSLDKAVWTQLRGYYVLGSRPDGIVREAIRLQTDSGKRFVYEQFKRPVYELNWVFTSADMDYWKAFETAVKGDIVPFWFNFSAGNPIGAIYVRKEPNFDPAERRQKTTGPLILYDFSLRISEETHPWPGE